MSQQDPIVIVSPARTAKGSFQGGFARPTAPTADRAPGTDGAVVSPTVAEAPFEAGPRFPAASSAMTR